MGFFDFLKSNNTIKMESAERHLNEGSGNGAEAELGDVKVEELTYACDLYRYHFDMTRACAMQGKITAASEHCGKCVELFNNKDVAKTIDANGMAMVIGFDEILKELVDAASKGERALDLWQKVAMMEPAAAPIFKDKIDEAMREPDMDICLTSARYAIAFEQSMQKARDIIKKAIATFGESYDALLLLGSCYLNIGRHKEAEETLEKARAIKEDAPSLYTQLALLYSSMGDPGRAITELDEAIYQSDDPSELLMLKGNMLFEAEVFDAAAECYIKVLDDDPQNFEALGRLAIIACIEEDDRAVKNILDRMREIDPDRAEGFAKQIGHGSPSLLSTLVTGGANIFAANMLSK